MQCTFFRKLRFPTRNKKNRLTNVFVLLLLHIFSEDFNLTNDKYTILIAIPVNVLSPKAINQFIVNHFDSDRKSPKST